MTVLTHIDKNGSFDLEGKIDAGIRLVAGGSQNPPVTYPILINSVMTIDIANNGYIASYKD